MSASMHHVKRPEEGDATSLPIDMKSFSLQNRLCFAPSRNCRRKFPKILVFFCFLFFFVFCFTLGNPGTRAKRTVSRVVQHSVLGP